MRSRLHAVAALGLFALSLQSAHRLWRSRTMRTSPIEACAAVQESRFAALRPYLPVIGTVGWKGTDEVGDCSSVQIAQYSLAPLIVSDVEWSTYRTRLRAIDEVLPDRFPLVVVDRRSPTGERWLTSQSDYEIVVERRGLAIVAPRPHR